MKALRWAPKTSMMGSECNESAFGRKGLPISVCLSLRTCHLGNEVRSTCHITSLVITSGDPVLPLSAEPLCRCPRISCSRQREVCRWRGNHKFGFVSTGFSYLTLSWRTTKARPLTPSTLSSIHATRQTPVDATKPLKPRRSRR